MIRSWNCIIKRVKEFRVWNICFQTAVQGLHSSGKLHSEIMRNIGTKNIILDSDKIPKSFMWNKNGSEVFFICYWFSEYLNFEI